MCKNTFIFPQIFIIFFSSVMHESFNFNLNLLACHYIFNLHVHF